MVLAALEALSASNSEGGTPYDYWFKSLEMALMGRGKMGSLVGASDEVKRSGIDSSLNEYAVRSCNHLLEINVHLETVRWRISFS